ncbi:AzlC family ABC transporter permease [Amaricoccus macauensis]|uniref:AzlC family ABC transporter permease n=1 Tax=Amaricoccus macauensis TaxID=57001 RepID=UPI003C7CD7B5
MPRSPNRSAFLEGFRLTVPLNVVIVPFALLFGVLAGDAGWDAFRALAMSVVVIAGASQFAALQLIEDNAPFIVIVMTGMAVNLRMAMYSAALVPHLGAAPRWQRVLAAYALTDQTYALSVRQFEMRPEMSMGERMAFFAGSASALCPIWYAFTIVGVVAGQAIPPEFGLDFAAPVTFIALFAPLLRSVPHLAAAFVSVIAALIFGFLPYNLWMIVAAVLAMATGATVETLLERRAR